MFFKIFIWNKADTKKHLVINCAWFVQKKLFETKIESSNTLYFFLRFCFLNTKPKKPSIITALLFAKTTKKSDSNLLALEFKLKKTEVEKMLKNTKRKAKKQRASKISSLKTTNSMAHKIM